MSNFFFNEANMTPRESVAPSGLSDVIAASYTSTKKNFLSNSRSSLHNQALRDREQEITALTNIPISQILQDVDGENIVERTRAIDDFIRTRREIEPDIYNDLKTTEEALEDAGLQALEAQQDLARSMQGSSNPLNPIGAFLGGFGAQVNDPMAYLGLALGGPASGSVVRFALTEAAIGAGLETAVQPSIMQWQREIGQEYGLGDVISGIGMAAVFSGGFAGTIKGAQRVLSTPMSQVYTRIADSEVMPQNVRDAARSAARFEQVRENRPKNMGIDEGVHRANIENTVKVMREGGRSTDVPIAVRQNDIAVEDLAYNYLDDSLKINEVAATRLVKGDVVKSGVSLGDIGGGTTVSSIPARSVDNLNVKVIDNFKQIRKEKKKLDQLKARLASVEKRGVDPRRKKQPETQDDIDTIRNDLETRIEAQEDLIFSIDDANKSMEAIMRDAQPGARLDGSGEYTMVRMTDDPVGGGPAFKGDEFLDDDFTQVDRFIRQSNELDTPEVQAALDADFSRALDEAEGVRFFDEDGRELTTSQIQKDIQKNERVIESLTTCARVV